MVLHNICRPTSTSTRILIRSTAVALLFDQRPHNFVRPIFSCPRHPPPAAGQPPHCAHGVPTMPGYPPEPVLGKRKRAEPKHYDPAQAPQRGRRRSTEQAEQRKSAQVSGAVSGAATAATDATAATAAKTATVVATTGSKRNRSHDNRRRRRPGRKDKAFDPSKRRRGSWLDTPTKAKILTRYSLCLERRQAGLPVKETAADIAREFGVDGAVPRRLWVKNQQGKDLRTQRAAAGRPLEFGADAEAALIEQLRDNRKGKHKRSSAENKLAHDLAEKGLVNPKTNKPYGHATIGRARKRLKFTWKCEMR